jgi:intracellular sulfur oxidation DsrE/DsrF family protein
MRNRIVMALVAMAAALLVAAGAGQAGGRDDNRKMLAGLTTARAYFDVRVETPQKLANLLQYIDRTYGEVAAAGVAPQFVVGFRSKSSFFVTKGDDYVLEEDLPAMKKVEQGLQRLKERGIVLEQCLFSAQLYEIEPQDFLPQLDLVENGYIALIAYQARGYALVPMD